MMQDSFWDESFWSVKTEQTSLHIVYTRKKLRKTLFSSSSSSSSHFFLLLWGIKQMFLFAHIGCGCVHTHNEMKMYVQWLKLNVKLNMKLVNEDKEDVWWWRKSLLCSVIHWIPLKEAYFSPRLRFLSLVKVAN